MNDQTRMKVLRNFANGAGTDAISRAFRLDPDAVEAVLASVNNRRDRAMAEAKRLQASAEVAAPKAARVMPAETQLLTALTRDLADLERQPEDVYSVCGYVVPDEVVAAAIEKMRARIAALKTKEVVA
jgi:hypothetical protein